MSGTLSSEIASRLSQDSGNERLTRAAREALDDVFKNRPPDPLARLMDPGFTAKTWEYEYSSTDFEIPGNLHVKQAEVLSAEAKHWWLFWGNQVGKTTLGAVSMALWALGRHPQQLWEPPLTMWASALTWEQWEDIVLPELLTWLPTNRVVDAPPPKGRSTKRTILVRADNGSITRIVGKSASQGRALYQSARIHVFWMDEEHPLSIWQEVQPRLVRFGGVTIATMTPLLGLTWVHEQHYEPWKLGKLKDTFCSHAGLVDNPVATKDRIEKLKREYMGDPAQLAARLFGHFTRPAGLAIQFDRTQHMQSWDQQQVDASLKGETGWTQYGGIDFGHWRFAFVHLAADRAKRSHVLGEYFSQKEDLETRTRWIDAHLRAHHAPDTTRIWGDAANPTDILQMNKEFKRIRSPYRVRPVLQERKLRRPSVTRINNLLQRGALVVRRDLGELMQWRLRQSAASDGHQILGSRLLWEVNNWRYVAPKHGGDVAQEQDPKDDTADGADAIAALRYAIMSYYSAPKRVKPKPKRRSRNWDTGLEDLDRRMEKEPWASMS